ncbi:MAG: UTP--glucose-1-phosphate uridylyltransferase [Deltaproteobacteria bacterium]|nr:UTP--glucose-1-phosphate uridylyltransferase [Deltaproteobacteria bacterium]
MPAVRTAVMPVAGLGTRFLPVTKAVPKEMLPIGDRPCIEYVVAEAVAAGIERIVFVSSRGKDALVDYFDRSPALEAHLREAGKVDLLAEVLRVAKMAEVVSVRQGEALGLGHAVLTAAPAVGNEPFAVLLGDDVVDAQVPAIGQLIAAGAASGAEAVVALMEVPRADTRRYGVCAGTFEQPGRMRVRAMVEKPEPEVAPSNFAIVGRYVLPARIFEVLRHTPRGRGGEIQLTDAIAVLAAEGAVIGEVFAGQRFDTGDLLGLLRASLHFSAKRPELRAGVDAMVQELLRGDIGR